MQYKQGGNKELMRRANRGLLLSLLATGQCISRIELSRRMGLSKMAVSNIVGDLISRDILAEGGMESSNEPGRRPVRLEISPHSPKVIGLLIFRDRCEAVLSDLGLHILAREAIPLESVTREGLIGMLFQLVDAMLARAQRVLGIGVASIGPVDALRGVILGPKYFFGIENVPVVQILSERYGLPVFFENDNQCGVLAEKLYGAGRNYSDIILIGAGRGVGCGIVLDDALHTNKRRSAPEFGHVSIDHEGDACICGNRGCIEAYIATPVLLAKLRAATGKSYSFQAFCELDSRPEIRAILNDAIDKLAAALVSVTNLLSFELVLLAYDAIYYSDRLLRRLEEGINMHRFSTRMAPVKVLRPQYLQDAQLLGAVCLVNTQVFAGNLPPVDEPS